MIHGFRAERVTAIPELRSTAAVYSHAKSGARLIHLSNDDPDNLFCIGLRTPVFDHSGAPHILEHSVLGGSRKFPVKDPFQVLLKGSLQTFLNALTYPDKTLYPVSSQVEKDFFNLVDVYCDAVFRPLLRENTFYQEGWHFDAERPEGPVTIKGIVYNEMKGVFSDFSSHVIRRTIAALYPDTTYFFESGGDPEHIPDLTYDKFRQFHSRFYHPSNSYIFLYGNLPAEKTLAFLDRNYLGAFDRIAVDSAITPQPRWNSPRRIEIDAPGRPEDEGTATVALCWLFGDTTDPVQTLVGTVLSRYLLGSESSPLRRALIDSGLGEDLDDLCGFDPELIQSFFAAGLRKSRPERADAVRDLIFDILRRQADDGLDMELLEGAVRNAEFQLREISGSGRFPYSLKLADRCFRSWIYGGDPLAHLAFDAPLTIVREGIRDGDAFFRKEIRERLLDNKHYVVSVVKASAATSGKLGTQTDAQVARLTAAFTPQDVERCHALTRNLVEEQQRPSPPEGLAAIPKIDRKDLPRAEQAVPVEETSAGGARAFFHALFTAGISYLDIGFDCSRIPADLFSYIPLFAELSTRCGARGISREKMATRIALVTGGISCSILVDERIDTPAPLIICFFHGKSLGRRFDDMRGIFEDLLCAPALDDPGQLRDLLTEMRNDFNASVINNGHTLAAAHAASRLNRTRLLAERLEGISQLRFLDRLVRENRIEKTVEKLQRLHDLLINRHAVLFSCTADTPAKHLDSCGFLARAIPAGVTLSPEIAVTADIHAKGPDTGIEINAAINFVARSWLPGNAPDASCEGLFRLLGQNLSRGYLWDTIRVEGGAYGAFASLLSTYPAFSCASYRDPNLATTLRRFDDGLRAVAKGLDRDTVEQSIVGTIGQIDKPKTPHARGFGESRDLLLERTPRYRRQIRETVLDATPQALAASARQILDSTIIRTSVLGSAAAFDLAEKDGTVLKREPLLEIRT